MFKAPKKVKEKYSISEYIEGDDYFNSTLLRRIKELEAAGEYIIDKNEYRIDLIASSIYGRIEYSQILLYYNGIKIDDLSIGRRLFYPSKDSIDNLIKEINKR